MREKKREKESSRKRDGKGFRMRAAEIGSFRDS